jgi:hypothetical protein
MATFATIREAEQARARVLKAFVLSGLLFMLVPGTFLGVWNLVQISQRESVGLVSAEWLQAHGHAQIFGWIGTFILGIGLYSIPKLREGAKPAVAVAWTCWTLWVCGVSLRWFANVYGWHWRALLPVSAVLELCGFLTFLLVVSRHRPPNGVGITRSPNWIWVVVAASAGFASTLMANLVLCLDVARHGESPAFAHGVDQRFLVLAAWGFLAPFIWGFSLNWLPTFLGLRPPRMRAAAIGVAINTTAVVLALLGRIGAATAIFVLASTAVVFAVRIFEPSTQPARTRGVHPSFSAFVRIAYVWLIVAALLGVAAAKWDVSGGIWGASRHAFTVGFVSMMVFAIGQRVLPPFAGLQPLWSPRLMVTALTLLAGGCLLRVSSEVVAYQHYAAWAWPMLPVSALIEMAAVSAFALNIAVTLLIEPEGAGDAAVPMGHRAVR